MNQTNISYQTVAKLNARSSLNFPFQAHFQEYVKTSYERKLPVSGIYTDMDVLSFLQSFVWIESCSGSGPTQSYYLIPTWPTQASSEECTPSCS